MMSDTISKDESLSGWINGFIGVLLFSGSMPATKLAVMEMSPIFVTIARAAIAGILALSVLMIYKEKRPEKKQIFPLLLVSVGCVVGFPLLSALALQYLTSAHSIVFLGMLPLATAVFGVFRGGERPHPVFWFFSVIGSLLVIGYAVSQGISASPIGDILMLIAVILCGMGYAEGAKLSKTLGGWQVISWALVLALPVMIPLFFIYFPDHIETVSFKGWFGMAYISLFSMFIGFIFWYKGLAQGGIATVGQLQLLQPFFGLGLAAYFLHEQVSIGMLGVTVGVILCVAGTKKFAK
ncbi:Permease of the drug/metabolite transporter (DMT) superfamily [Chryseobacterium vrystaatense]|uniref:Permease of the drug/metabolite transporter (DMT) superfamily n=2 Tax=Chryseobacterium vrystaatense TaxID=307480 RepID=A0A1M5E8Z9_9FLAO|nr:DMT family transporter [Chryseobacterium vrystaatense]SHF75728.1 Permease of the drug/metabolite transporter (DMT) superfamily [Chryseobacterium vrystaatense]